MKQQLIQLINSFLESKNMDARIPEDAENFMLTTLNFNSIEFIDLVVQMEVHFDCEFDDSLLDRENFLSLNALTDYLVKITA